MNRTTSKEPGESAMETQKKELLEPLFNAVFNPIRTKTQWSIKKASVNLSDFKEANQTFSLTLTHRSQKSIFKSGLLKIDVNLELAHLDSATYQQIKKEFTHMSREQIVRPKVQKQLKHKTPSRTKQLLATPIIDTTLPFRIKKICIANDLHRVSELAKQGPANLLKIPNISYKSVNDIEEFFLKNDLRWNHLIK
jgi:hypothetical protein